MSFKRPYVPHQWGRKRTDEEVDLDRRLAANAQQAAGQRLSRDDWIKAQYRAMSRSGAKSKAYFEGHFQARDVRIMDEHVDQMFWQMVRMELRKPGSKLQKWLEFIESYYEVPQHEFLDRIKKRHWALMQVWTDDRDHRSFLQEVYRAWHAAQEAIAPEDPRLARIRWLAEEERRYADEQDTRYYDDLMMAEVLEELGQ